MTISKMTYITHFENLRDQLCTLQTRKTDWVLMANLRDQYHSFNFFFSPLFLILEFRTFIWNSLIVGNLDYMFTNVETLNLDFRGIVVNFEVGL